MVLKKGFLLSILVSAFLLLNLQAQLNPGQNGLAVNAAGATSTLITCSCGATCRPRGGYDCSGACGPGSDIQ